MKMKKGKVYPSPSSSSSSHHLNEEDSLSILSLLPATILVLVSALSAQDRQVLAYLITRGTTTISSIDSKKVKKKKNKSNKNHKPPVFDCECFDCYTNYWFLWDSSPNRELIHEIIEAFENHNHHLTLSENSTSRTKSKRGKKKVKSTRKDDNKLVFEVEPIVPESHMSSPGRLSEEVEEETQDGVAEDEEESTVVLPVAAASRHKGLARKVLPDVLGLINSNIWKLWNPNA